MDYLVHKFIEMKIYLTRTIGGLRPTYDSDLEKLKKIPYDISLEYETKIVRNLAFHKKYFALIKLVFENQERYTNIDHLRKAVQIEAGYYSERISLQGELIIEPTSISFATMDNTEFDKLYNDVIEVIIRFFKFDKKEIEDNILNFY